MTREEAINRIDEVMLIGDTKKLINEIFDDFEAEKRSMLLTQEDAKKHHKTFSEWAESPNNTILWGKTKNSGWFACTSASFKKEIEIVVDSDWAELRIAQIDGKQLQFNFNCGWGDETLTYGLMDGSSPEEWRIKPEIEFPIYRRSKEYNLIVKFTERQKGTVVMSDGKPYQIGHTDNCWVPFDYSRWESVETVKIDGATLFDTQPVWAWDEGETTRTIGFFDAENKCLFTPLGYRSGMCCDHYAPIENIELWMIEAWLKLET